MLVLLWYGVGMVLVLFCRGVDKVFDKCWSGFGMALVWFRYCLGKLVLF